MKALSQPADFLNPSSAPEEMAPEQPGSPLKIRDIQTTVTAPEGCNLIVVRSITEPAPGLSGPGCATFCHRHRAVRAMIDRHPRPLLIGRELDLREFSGSSFRGTIRIDFRSTQLTVNTSDTFFPI